MHNLYILNIAKTVLGLGVDTYLVIGSHNDADESSTKDIREG